MSVPTATKNSTANTSRNGSSRRRASAVSARLLIARPPTNAARAAGTPNQTAPAAASASPDATDTIRNRSCSDRRWRRTIGSTWAGDDREDDVGGEQREGDRQRPAVGAGRRDDHRAQRHPGDVLEHAPAEQALVGRLVRRPPARAGDVDDDHGARHGHRQADQGRAVRRQADREQHERGHGRRDPDLQRRRPQEPAVLAPHVPEVDLDADLEQEQHDPDVGQELDLVAVGDVAGRERRHGEPGREVADDGREPELARDPAERRGEQQREPDVEQEVRRCPWPEHSGRSAALGESLRAGNQRARRRRLRARACDEAGRIRPVARGRARSRPAPRASPAPWVP